MSEEHKTKIKIGNTGKKMSAESIRKSSEKRRGRKMSEAFRSRCSERKHSDESKRKISDAKRGNTYQLGKKRSEESRHLMSKRRAEFIKKYGAVPSFNVAACHLFDEINREMGWSGIHALSGGEQYVDGYWVDFYEPNENIVIEFDEYYHKARKEKDALRQKKIVEILGCRFFRIEEGQESTWRKILTETHNDTP